MSNSNEVKLTTFRDWLANKKEEVGWYSSYPQLEEFLRCAWEAGRASNEGSASPAVETGNSPSVSALLLALEEARKALRRIEAFSDPEDFLNPETYIVAIHQKARSALSTINKVLANQNFGES